MAEEKQTPTNEPLNDTLTSDDTDMLRRVLQDSHSRGISPVSVYRQADALPEEF